jgi:hypothetical protein
MTKPKMLKFLNPIIFVLFLAQGITGFLMSFSTAAYEVHSRLIWVLFFGIIMHIYLNWAWIKTTFFKKK